jgi:putative transposase
LLAIELKRVHKKSGGTYGGRRITAQLKRDGISFGKNRISRLMK